MNLTDKRLLRERFLENYITLDYTQNNLLSIKDIFISVITDLTKIYAREITTRTFLVHN